MFNELFDDLEEAFLANRLRPNSNVSLLPHIGPHLTNRLHGRGLNTLQQVVDYFFEATDEDKDAEEDEIDEKLRDLVANRRGNQCVNSHSPVTGDLRYHIPDINYPAWHTMIALLEFANINPWFFDYEDLDLQLPDPFRRRDNAGKFCTCIKRRNECEAAQVGHVDLCEWVSRRTRTGRRSQCIPRPHLGNRSFRGRSGYSDQMIRVGQPSHGNITYGPASHHRKWRRPKRLVP